MLQFPSSIITGVLVIVIVTSRVTVMVIVIVILIAVTAIVIIIMIAVTVMIIMTVVTVIVKRMIVVTVIAIIVKVKSNTGSNENDNSKVWWVMVWWGCGWSLAMLQFPYLIVTGVLVRVIVT